MQCICDLNIQSGVQSSSLITKILTSGYNAGIIKIHQSHFGYLNMKLWDAKSLTNYLISTYLSLVPVIGLQIETDLTTDLRINNGFQGS